MAEERPQTYWILASDQLAAMASPRRQDIVDRLAATGPLSVKELAAQIGARPPALYHHLDRLIAVGLVVEAGARTVRRKQEKLYATPAPRMRMARALAEGGRQPLMDSIVASLTRQMARDFEAGGRLASRCAEGEQRNYGFFRLLGRPGPADMARINACLQEVAEILWEKHDPAAGLVCLGWVLTPLEDAGPQR